MPKRNRKRMKLKHNFPIRRENPITGEITMENQPHTVLIPKEPVTIFLTVEGVEQSKKLRGRGNSQVCSGSVCTYRQRDLFTHGVTGVTDFLYARAFIQSDARKRECYGYTHEEGWFPKMNDKKGGHDLLLEEIRKHGGPIPLTLYPIRVQKWDSSREKGKTTGEMPRRSPRRRGSHLRAIVGKFGFGAAYDNEKENKK